MKQTEIENNQPITSLETMIIKAIELGNVETIAKMLELKERVDKENARRAFKDDFAKWQANKPIIKRDKTVSFGNTKYRYATLSSTQKQVDPILSEVGISYRWEQELKEKKINITCIVSHRDGHEEKTTLEADNDTSGNKNNIQSVGSTVTYLKRYTLEAALGLSSDYDDDGKSSGNPIWWDEAVKYLKSGGKIEVIEKKYPMSESEKKNIIKAVNGS